MSEEQPRMMIQHLYEGKVFDIWAAWQSDDPENYVLGRSKLEACENFAMRVPVVFEHAEGGGIIARSPKFKELEGHGPSSVKAEKDLMRKINLLSDKPDWREMFFELLAATGDAWQALSWAEREKAIVRREVERRAVAVQFSTKGTAEPEARHAETPFRSE